MVKPLTPSQRDVVAHERGPVLVSAGAGSGKTTTVVQFLCHRLGVAVQAAEPPLAPAGDRLTLDDIAAITFTNQAAADLKRKLRAALLAAGQRDLATDVDAARIGTIHSFCGDLLREFALRAGLSAAAAVIEEGDASALALECARDAVLGALAERDIPELGALFARAKFSEIARWTADLAQDTDRLSRIAANAVACGESERALVRVAVRAAELRRARLVRESSLDFDEMVAKVRDMLQNADVRRAVQARLRLLVLDEAQDADPVQRDIAFLLGGLVHDDDAPTEIVLVGDPKQSIYRFRRADVALWNDSARAIRERGGKVQPLADNFRSHASILAFVDAAIAPSFDAPIADDGQRRPFEVDYAPLVPRADSAAARSPGVELITVDSLPNGKPRKAGQVRMLEAGSVAMRIAELRAEGVPYGDVAILLTGWGAVATYENALRAAGVPYYLLRAEGFWEAREILDCVLALRAIRNPRDDVALAGFLKSPFVGVRDDTLLALARAKQGSLWAAMPGAHAERELLAHAHALLTRLGALRDRVSPAELLERLDAATGFVASVALGPAGAQGVANYRKLMRIATDARDQSLGEFLRTVEDVRARDDREAPERLYRERSDVVTITSVHSAKGLEWPVVFWCDLVREFRSSSRSAFLVGRDRICIKDPTATDDEGSEHDDAHAAFARELDEEARAEQVRVWYVATTRAKQLLVLSGIPLVAKAGPPSPASALRARFPALATSARIEYTGADGVTYGATVRRATLPRSLTREPEALALSVPRAPDPVRVPSGRRRLSASQLLTFDHDPATWWARYVLRFELPDIGTPDAQAAQRAQRALLAGQLTHDVLEQCDAAGINISELIDDAMARAATDAIGLDFPSLVQLRRAIRSNVLAAQQSRVWQALAAHPTAARELAFTRVVDGDTVLAGAMDLAALRDAPPGAAIVDVKSSTAPAEVLRERYGVQARVYADAVRAIAGVEDVSFTLVAVPTGVEASVDASAGIADLVTRLRHWRSSAAVNVPAP